jgi:hypothetical protein
MGRVIEAEGIRSVPEVHSRLPDDTDKDLLLWALGEGRAGKVVPRSGSIYKAGGVICSSSCLSTRPVRL